MSISHHPRVCEGGAKPPRYSFFMMKIFTGFLLIALCAVPVLSAPLWLESGYDSITLWLTPPSKKALQAADIALDRVNEIKEADFDRIYAVQELLTIIEQNLEVPGNAHKALRTQQEVEERLRLLKEKLTELREQENSEQYALVLLHASLRTDLLLQEAEFAKEKTRAKF